jgi:hypothetical protein
MPRAPIASAVALALAAAGAPGLAGCGEAAGAPDASVDSGDGAVGQGSEARSDLVVNEVAPRVPGGPDWFEILNRSGEPIDLCDFLVTDATDRLDHYHPLGGVLPPEPCPPRLLGPGQYLVVLADGGAGEGPDHAPFKLAPSDELHILSWTGETVDALLYLHLGEPGTTLSRAPDGTGLFYLAAPTPGAANPPRAGGEGGGP